MAHAIRSTQKQLNKVTGGVESLNIQDSRNSILSNKSYELNAAYSTKRDKLKNKLLKQQNRLTKRLNDLVSRDRPNRRSRRLGLQRPIEPTSHD